MKKLMLIFCCLTTFINSYSMQTSHPLNIILIFKPAFDSIFFQKQALNPANMQKWNDAIAKINRFVEENNWNLIKGFGKNKDIIKAWNITKDAAQQMIHTLNYIRNVAGSLRTIKNAQERKEFKRPIENQLNELENMFFIAKDMMENTKCKNINQENARNAVKGTADYIQKALLSDLQAALG